MFENKLNYKIINITALMLLLYISFSNLEMWWNILATVISILTPFIISFAFAYALTPVLNFIVRKGINKRIGVIIITVVLLLVVSSLFIITLPLVYDQLILFSKNIISAVGDFSSHFNLNLGNVEIKMEDQLNTIIGNLGEFISNGTFDFVNKSLSFIGKFILGFITGVYFLADMDNIKRKIKLVTSSISKKFFLYIKSLDMELGNYVKGLVTFMIIQFVEYSFLFWLVHHPNWLLLGILASLTTVIPYFGGLITNIIGIITASTLSTPILIGTIIICLVFPQLDGYVISPRIYGKTNNVNPIVTIIAVSIGGTISGVMGIIVALPVYLLIRATYHFFIGDLKSSVKKIKSNV